MLQCVWEHAAPWKEAVAGPAELAGLGLQAFPIAPAVFQTDGWMREGEGERFSVWEQHKSQFRARAPVLLTLGLFVVAVSPLKVVLELA